MPTYLQQQLIQRMQEKNLTINALEKRANLKESTVRNIIKGKSKNPRVETLDSIAHVLGCSIVDLMHDPSGKESSSPMADQSHKLEEELFLDTIKVLFDLYKEKNCLPTLEETLFYIKEAYLYALKVKSVDKNFIEWFIERKVGSS